MSVRKQFTPKFKREAVDTDLRTSETPSALITYP